MTGFTTGLRARMPEEIRHILIGAGVVVFALLVFAVLAGRGAGSVNGYEIVAGFDSVDGIFIDSPVRVAGVRVGRVAALDYDSSRRRAVVTMEIQSAIEMPDDSIAIVTSEGFLGDRFIRLDPGGSLDMLADGAEVEFTQGSILFTELLAKVILTVERRRRAEEEAAADAATQDAAGDMPATTEAGQ